MREIVFDLEPLREICSKTGEKSLIQGKWRESTPWKLVEHAASAFSGLRKRLKTDHDLTNRQSGKNEA